jgi:hypothetical protein
MATSVSTPRKPRRGLARPSVREVCLLGGAAGQAEGSRLTWSGRLYRVESVPGTGYLHLVAEPAGRGPDRE